MVLLLDIDGLTNQYDISCDLIGRLIFWIEAEEILLKNAQFFHHCCVPLMTNDVQQLEICEHGDDKAYVLAIGLLPDT